MKNLNVSIVYTWENEQGREVESKAALGGEWEQWGATTEELAEIMPLTEKLNDAVNEFISDNCEEEED